MKKGIDRVAGGAAPGGTQSPGLMPGMGSPGMMGGVGMQPPPRAGTPDNPVGGPPSVISAQQGFGEAGTLPSPDPSLIARSSGGSSCTTCGSVLRPNAKVCTKCGSKV